MPIRTWRSATFCCRRARVLVRRYGPIVVARSTPSANGLRGKRIAIPGKMTTAYLVLQLYEPEFEPVFTPFDQILETVVRGGADAGVVIHEGQLTYAESGLRKIVDLGEWWHHETVFASAARRQPHPEVA